MHSTVQRTRDDDIPRENGLSPKSNHININVFSSFDTTDTGDDLQ